MRPFKATRSEDGSLAARVVHVDRYGNLITDVRGDQLADREAVVEIAERTITGLSRTYEHADGLAAIIASTGFLAIVVPNGSAATELGVDIGEPVTVRVG